MLALVGVVQAQELISDGGFESQPLGASVSANPPHAIKDSTTFADWCFESVPDNEGKVASFTATTIGNASEGSKAMGLSVDNSIGAENFTWSLNRRNAPVPVKIGQTYTLSFDAAHVSGDPTMYATLQFLDASGNYVEGPPSEQFSVSSDYQTFSISYTPTHSDTSQVVIAFAPYSADGSASVSIDNVKFGDASKP